MRSNRYATSPGTKATQRSYKHCLRQALTFICTLADLCTGCASSKRPYLQQTNSTGWEGQNLVLTTVFYPYLALCDTWFQCKVLTIICRLYETFKQLTNKKPNFLVYYFQWLNRYRLGLRHLLAVPSFWDPKRPLRNFGGTTRLLYLVWQLRSGPNLTTPLINCFLLFSD